MGEGCRFPRGRQGCHLVGRFYFGRAVSLSFMGPDRVASGDNLNVVDGCCYFLIREMVRVEERCEIWGGFKSIHDCLYNMVLLGVVVDAQFFYGDDILGGLKEDVDCYETEGLTNPEMV